MNTTETKIADNGRRLKPHDGCTEWSVCAKCGTLIDWANDVMFSAGSGRDRDDTTCPHCGHDDTAWLYADNPELAKRVIKHIAAFRARPHQLLLETCYGPRALPLRTQVAAMILDRKVTGSDKKVQWCNFRQMLWDLVGATGDCIASQDHEFHRIADELLQS